MGELLSARGWSVSVVAKEPDPLPSPSASAPLTSVERVSVAHRQSLLLRIANFRLAARSALRGEGEGRSHQGSKGSVAPATAEDKPSALRTVLSMTQELRWARDAVARGRAISGESVLLSAGPPHTIHYTVSRLARKLRVPHVMDLRDPWSMVERLPPWVDIRLHRSITRVLEAKAVRDAALVVCNTGHAAEAMRREYPGAASRIVYVMNGADPEDIPETPDWSGDRFMCVHSGTIYLDRMPIALLRAARTVIDRLSLSPREFGIAFRGVVEDRMQQQIVQLVESLDLTPYVEILPRIERKEAMRWTASAQLCVVLPQDSKMALPSKVFELAQLRSWMLVFAPSDSATATALRGTTAFVVEPEDESAATDALLQAIAAFRAGDRPVAVDLEGAMLRERQAEKLHGYLAPIAAKLSSRVRDTQ